MITLYYQTKTSISFWCKWGLNPRSLIQPSDTLPVELIETHMIIIIEMSYFHPFESIVIPKREKCDALKFGTLHS